MQDGSIFPPFNEAHYNARFGRAERQRDRRATKAREMAHKTFDPIWRRGYMKRSEAYLWLALQLGIPQDDCHMGMMTNAECQRVVEVSKKYLAEKEGRKLARKAPKRGARHDRQTDSDLQWPTTPSGEATGQAGQKETWLSW